MASNPEYLAVPTDDVEMEQLSVEVVSRLDRQPSSASGGSAEAGKRVRLLNERRRERLNTELLNAVSQKNIDLVTRQVGYLFFRIFHLRKGCLVCGPENPVEKLIRYILKIGSISSFTA